MAHHTGALDQGTTSTRFIVFDSNGRIVCCAQKEHRQIYPQPGWVEHDPEEIWRATQTVIRETMAARCLATSILSLSGILPADRTAEFTSPTSPMPAARSS